MDADVDARPRDERSEGVERESEPRRRAREHGGDPEPDDPEGAGERKGLEERVERLAAMVDDPALEIVIEASQVRGVPTAPAQPGSVTVTVTVTVVGGLTGARGSGFNVRSSVRVPPGLGPSSSARPSESPAANRPAASASPSTSRSGRKRRRRPRACRLR